ncbi:hypothetical protein FRUB_02171 [Fimbriiglobus ruber]|uniref:Uncharacterized protein n=1 Tax=Fimbriiglobus ruber TaxID=1908690 RepID=A0A225E425_9BACT|nr:hypothetical protein FRUB_02171 [Fimbriiglobus ruber]
MRVKYRECVVPVVGRNNGVRCPVAPLDVRREPVRHKRVVVGERSEYLVQRLTGVELD